MRTENSDAAHLNRSVFAETGGTEKSKKMMDEAVYQRYLSALLQGNRSQFMDVVGLSVSVYFNMSPLKRMIETVRTHYAHLDILVGGQAFRWGGDDVFRMFPRTTYVPSLSALTQGIGAEGGDRALRKGEAL